MQAPTIRLLYEEETFPLYYFEITEEQWDDLRNDEKDAILFMRFAGEADLIVDINNRFLTVDTRNERTDRFRQDVTRFVEEGNNYLELEPRRDTRIVDLELFLVASD